MKEVEKIYYKSKLCTVRDAKIGDVFDLADNLRMDDIAEIWKAYHRTPQESLMNGFMDSVLCFTVERNERAIIMFGIVTDSILGNVATIWLLGSPEIDKIQKVFLKKSGYFISLMLDYYPILHNYVDVENRQSIKWLKWCGAKMGPVVPFGEEKAPFQYFQFRR